MGRSQTLLPGLGLAARHVRTHRCGTTPIAATQPVVVAGVRCVHEAVSYLHLRLVEIHVPPAECDQLAASRTGRRSQPQVELELRVDVVRRDEQGGDLPGGRRGERFPFRRRRTHQPERVGLDSFVGDSV